MELDTNQHIGLNKKGSYLFHFCLPQQSRVATLAAQYNWLGLLPCDCTILRCYIQPITENKMGFHTFLFHPVKSGKEECMGMSISFKDYLYNL